MIEHDDQSISAWKTTAALNEFPALAQNERADVCIIGAGITGLTTAYLLGCVGKSVVVVDDGPIASGETERTTAHLTVVLENRYFELEKLHGEIGARLVAESHAAAIDQIERIVAKEKIDCGFERLNGYLFVPPGESSGVLERELASAHHVGLTNVQMIAHSPLMSFDTGPVLMFPGQAQFHPLNYIAALAKAIIRDGGRIYTDTHATKFKGGFPARIETKNGQVVTADALVVATNSPVNDLVAIHTKQAAYRTFVIAAPVPKDSVNKGLYWDTLNPYHYTRLQSLPAGQFADEPCDLLIVGGEDHKTGQADDAETRYWRLEEWARTRFPMMKEIKYKWSGQVMESIDGLAFIGRNPLDNENVYIATGDSGSGITHGTIAGMLLADMIQGRSNTWTSLYDPSRKTLGAVGRFAKETLNLAVQYADWFTSGDVKDDLSVLPGDGAIVRHGLEKAAVYRDDAGLLHECSAICPHLGGIVAWNHSEKTWDCPCHGSRFDKNGIVLNGPANTNLTPGKEVPAHSAEKRLSMNVLFVLTSHDQLGDTGKKTGFWLEEFAAPYYVLKNTGAVITLASPKGGQPPLDPASELPEFLTESTNRFSEDNAARNALANTKILSGVSADDFDAVFYPGGHGTVWDLPDNTASIALIEAFVKAGKPVAAVCHAPAAFVNVRGENGEYMIMNKCVTGFSNTEEEAVDLSAVVPFLLEDRLKERGGAYSKGADWAPHVQVDGNLVTGQNPASSKHVAEELMKLLRSV